LAGNNYNVIWLVMVCAQLLALVVILPVTLGEAKEEKRS
jgi:hypothetical protein